MEIQYFSESLSLKTFGKFIYSVSACIHTHMYVQAQTGANGIFGECQDKTVRQDKWMQSIICIQEKSVYGLFTGRSAAASAGDNSTAGAFL